VTAKYQALTHPQNIYGHADVCYAVFVVVILVVVAFCTLKSR